MDIGPEPAQQTVQPRITNMMVDLQDVGVGPTPSSASSGAGIVDSIFGQANSGNIASDLKPDLSLRRTTMSIDLGNQTVPSVSNPINFESSFKKTSARPSVTLPVQPSPVLDPSGNPAGIVDSILPLPGSSGLSSDTQLSGKIAEVPVTFGKSLA